MRADARRNREAILEAAKLLVIERGPDVTMDAVATRAGVGAGTLYRHFPDRTALFEGLLDTLAARVTGLCTDTLARLDDDPPGQWRRFVDELVDIGVGSLFPAMAPAVAEVVDLGDVDSPLGRTRLAIGRALSGVLDRVRAHGLVRDGVTSIEFALLLSKVVRPVVPADFIVEDPRRAVEVLLAGLRPDGRELPGEGPRPVGVDAELLDLVLRGGD